MSFTLRAATNEDAPSVAEVLLSSRKAFLPYAPFPHTDAEVHRWVHEVVVPSGGVTVACSGSVVVGVVAIARECNVSWINQLYIAPSHVEQRIGSRLLVHALSSLPLPVRLYTFQANERARLFYEKHGFKATAFSDGSSNEERCPDVLYEIPASATAGA